MPSSFFLPAILVFCLVACTGGVAIVANEKLSSLETRSSLKPESSSATTKLLKRCLGGMGAMYACYSGEDYPGDIVVYGQNPPSNEPYTYVYTGPSTGPGYGYPGGSSGGDPPPEPPSQPCIKVQAGEFKDATVSKDGKITLKDGKDLDIQVYPHGPPEICKAAAADAQSKSWYEYLPFIKDGIDILKDIPWPLLIPKNKARGMAENTGAQPQQNREALRRRLSGSGYSSSYYGGGYSYSGGVGGDGDGYDASANAYKQLRDNGEAILGSISSRLDELGNDLGALSNGPDGAMPSSMDVSISKQHSISADLNNFISLLQTAQPHMDSDGFNNLSSVVGAAQNADSSLNLELEVTRKVMDYYPSTFG